MLEKYKTLYKYSQTEIVEKKSRFIGHGKFILTDEDAQEFINNIKKEHFNASHNVFAYQIGDRNEIQRYSDDGEPTGTAGVPILSLLKNENIQNAVIVVTRYFGGTLLGTGGLVRAYQKTAKKILETSVVIEKNLCTKISILSDYNLSGKIQYELLNNNYILLDTLYTENVEFITLIEKSKLIEFLDLIKEITSGTIKPTQLENLYVAKINDKIKIFEN